MEQKNDICTTITDALPHWIYISEEEYDARCQKLDEKKLDHDLFGSVRIMYLNQMEFSEKEYTQPHLFRIEVDGRIWAYPVRDVGDRKKRINDQDEHAIANINTLLIQWKDAWRNATGVTQNIFHIFSKWRTHRFFMQSDTKLDKVDLKREEKPIYTHCMSTKKKRTPHKKHLGVFFFESEVVLIWLRINYRNYEIVLTDEIERMKYRKERSQIIIDEFKSMCNIAEHLELQLKCALILF